MNPHRHRFRWLPPLWFRVRPYLRYLSITLTALAVLFTASFWLRSYCVEDHLYFWHARISAAEAEGVEVYLETAHGQVHLFGHPCKLQGRENVEKMRVDAPMVEWHTRDLSASDLRVDVLERHPKGYRTSDAWLDYGFGFGWEPHPPLGDGTWIPYSWDLFLPHWIIAVPLALLLFWQSWRVLRRYLRRRRRLRDGLCLKCGYDLRASPVRCPECGTPTPRPAAAVKPA